MRFMPDLISCSQPTLCTCLSSFFFPHTHTHTPVFISSAVQNRPFNLLLFHAWFTLSTGWSFGQGSGLHSVAVNQFPRSPRRRIELCSIQVAEPRFGAVVSTSADSTLGHRRVTLWLKSLQYVFMSPCWFKMESITAVFVFFFFFSFI